MIPRYRISVVPVSDSYRRITKFYFSIKPNFNVKGKYYQQVVILPDYYAKECNFNIVKFSKEKVYKEFEPIKKALNMGLVAGLRLGKKLYSGGENP